MNAHSEDAEQGRRAPLRLVLVIVALGLVLVAVRTLTTAPQSKFEDFGGCDVTIYQAFVQGEAVNPSDDFFSPAPVNSKSCVDPARRQFALAVLAIAGASGAIFMRRRLAQRSRTQDA